MVSKQFVGYLLKDSIAAAADQNPDTQFGIIDDVIEGKDNVVSATFKDNEAAYLAGFAAAYTTKTKSASSVVKKASLSTVSKLVS